MSCGNCKCDCSCTPEKGDRGLPGIQGEQGIQGVPGIQGADGADGIDGAQGIQGLPGDDADVLFGAWNTLTLVNGWANNPLPSNPEYCKNNSELALMRGAIHKTFTSVGGADLIGILPVGYRPSDVVRFPVYVQISDGGQITAFTGTKWMTVELNTLGELYLMQIIGTGDNWNTTIDLSSITFRAEQ